MTDADNTDRFYVEANYLFDDQLADFVVAASRLPRLPIGEPVRTDLFRMPFGVTASVVFNTDSLDAAFDVARELIDHDMDACVPESVEDWGNPFYIGITNIDGLAQSMARDAAAGTLPDSLTGDFSWGIEKLATVTSLPVADADADDTSDVEAVAA